MLSKIRKFIPEPIISLYHRLLSALAMLWYRLPSRQLIVIGVTGTNGKSTTVALIKAILTAAGERVGATSTALISNGITEKLNDLKMTMPGRFKLQRILRQMVNNGCRYAVVETSSQGILQSRQCGINYDLAVFTNLTPEHIEAHGGFENYKNAKLELFRHLARSPRKNLKGQRISKAVVINADTAFAADFLVASEGVDEKWIYTIRGRAHQEGLAPLLKPVIADNLELKADHSTFTIQNVFFKLPLPGRYNVENALAAITAARALNLALPTITEGIKNIRGVPGRWEFIPSNAPFQVLVDYAPEPASLRCLYEALALLSYRRLIQVLGSAGGGRDIARRPILGELAGARADIVIVTNEDPYDDDPLSIITQVAEGARQSGKKDNETLFMIPDRQAALRKALTLAEEGDLVLATGKGCEQAIMVGEGKKIPWDEREALKALLQELGYETLE